MGHLGLTPQSFHQLGGFKVQGREPGAAERLIADAQALEAAGAYAIVLEGIPSEVANEVTAAVAIPTIGIGAGAGCDGQVLVVYDLLGMDERFKPKFVRRYADVGTTVRDACGRFIADVRAGTFPAAAESFSLEAPAPAPISLYAVAGGKTS
jgi:3-methyl-2-oxobutanoate hydroxymethyltransferase